MRRQRIAEEAGVADDVPVVRKEEVLPVLLELIETGTAQPRAAALQQRLDGDGDDPLLEVVRIAEAPRHGDELGHHQLRKIGGDDGRKHRTRENALHRRMKFRPLVRGKQLDIFLGEVHSSFVYRILP
jgi:hypothetical protein